MSTRSTLIGRRYAMLCRVAEEVLGNSIDAYEVVEAVLERATVEELASPRCPELVSAVHDACDAFMGMHVVAANDVEPEERVPGEAPASMAFDRFLRRSLRTGQRANDNEQWFGEGDDEEV